MLLDSMRKEDDIHLKFCFDILKYLPDDESCCACTPGLYYSLCMIQLCTSSKSDYQITKVLGEDFKRAHCSSIKTFPATSRLSSNQRPISSASPLIKTPRLKISPKIFTRNSDPELISYKITAIDDLWCEFGILEEAITVYNYIKNQVSLIADVYTKVDLKEIYKYSVERMFKARFTKITTWDTKDTTLPDVSYCVSKNTEQVIPQVIEHSLTSDTMALTYITTAYYKFSVNHPTIRCSRTTSSFWMSPLKVKKVPTLILSGVLSLGHSFSPTYQMVHVPTQRKNQIAIFLQPTAKLTIHELCQALKPEDFIQALENSKIVRATIYLPVIKIQTVIKAKYILYRLGIKSIFNPGKGGLTNGSNNPIYVDEIIHMLNLEIVNDKETNQDKNSRETTKKLEYTTDCEIHFNSPFLMIIYDSFYKVPLAISKIMD